MLSYLKARVVERTTWEGLALIAGGIATGLASPHPTLLSVGLAVVGAIRAGLPQ